MVTPDSTVTYQIIVTDSNGCANSDFITIFVEGGFSIYIPNAFTPNGDLHNNIFYVYGEDILDFTLSIYTRWGEKIFESKDITKGWDGTYKGVPLPIGTYVYMVEFTGESGGPESRAGKVSLIR
jgi:gliding motility-associated-like protein